MPDAEAWLENYQPHYQAFVYFANNLRCQGDNPVEWENPRLKNMILYAFMDGYKKAMRDFNIPETKDEM